METSDHVPCLVTVSTDIPRSHIFRFENFWLQHDDFAQQVQLGWVSPFSISDPAKNITAKFKNLRSVLKQWKQNLSSLKENIANVKLILSFLNILEEFIDLSLIEWNFRKLLEEKLISLLQQQKAYWKQRGAIKWATLGDAGTKFFHAQATVKYRRNFIAQLLNDEGNLVVTHAEKANLIWHSFKDRLGTSSYTSLGFDIAAHFTNSPDLSQLVSPFSLSEIDLIVRGLPSDKAPGLMVLTLISSNNVGQ